MDTGKPAENCIVVQTNVPTQRRIVCQHQVIPQHAIMRNMAISHYPVVVSDPGVAKILNRPAVDRAALANRIPVPDLETGRLCCVLLVLRIIPDRTELKYSVVTADPGLPADNDVGSDPRPCAYFDTGIDDRISADLDAVAEYRGRIDYGGRMDHA